MGFISTYHYTVIMSSPPKKSVVHHHFTMFDKQPDGTYKAKCDHCRIVLKGTSGGTTTNLLKHLKVTRLFSFTWRWFINTPLYLFTTLLHIHV